MILEDTGLVGLRSPLAQLDETAEKVGFVRWQWEYRRATYDLKLHDRESGDDYFLRFNTRAVEGRLEDPDAVLVIESVYLGKATFPHGLDYEAPIPPSILDAANRNIEQLKRLLA
jgi:hypothetical protein